MILVYVPPADLSSMEIVTKALAKSNPDFHWEVTADKQEVIDNALAFRINTSAEDPDLDKISFNLVWPSASKFLKNQKQKEAVWEDIQKKVIPAFLSQKNQPSLSSVSVTDLELSKMLAFIRESKTPYIIETKDGRRIGVGIENSDLDLNISASDIASMLAASLIFQAKQVDLRPTRSKSQGRDGAT